MAQAVGTTLCIEETVGIDIEINPTQAHIQAYVKEDFSSRHLLGLPFLNEHCKEFRDMLKAYPPNEGLEGQLEEIYTSATSKTMEAFLISIRNSY